MADGSRDDTPGRANQRKRDRAARRDAYERGVRAEALVADRLQDDGWVILARNWQGGGAELDLVVQRDGVLRFVEVKARDAGDDSALDALTRDKQRRIARAAGLWLDLNGEPEREAAFLVAIVSFEPGGWTVEWLDDAFDAPATGA